MFLCSNPRAQPRSQPTMANFISRFLPHLRNEFRPQDAFTTLDHDKPDATRCVPRLSLSVRLRRLPNRFRNKRARLPVSLARASLSIEGVDELGLLHGGQHATPKPFDRSRESFSAAEESHCCSSEKGDSVFEADISGDTLIVEDGCGASPEDQSKVVHSSASSTRDDQDGVPRGENAAVLARLHLDWSTLRKQLDDALHGGPSIISSLLIDRLLCPSLLSPHSITNTILPILPNLYTWISQHELLDGLRPTLRTLVAAWLDAILTTMPATHATLESTLHKQLAAWRGYCSCQHCLRITDFLARDFPQNPYTMGTVGAMNRWHVADRLQRFLRAHPELATWSAVHGCGPECSMWMIEKSEALLRVQRCRGLVEELVDGLLACCSHSQGLESMLGPQYERVRGFIRAKE